MTRIPNLANHQARMRFGHRAYSHSPVNKHYVCGCRLQVPIVFIYNHQSYRANISLKGFEGCLIIMYTK